MESDFIKLIGDDLTGILIGSKRLTEEQFVKIESTMLQNLLGIIRCPAIDKEYPENKTKMELVEKAITAHEKDQGKACLSVGMKGSRGSYGLTYLDYHSIQCDKSSTKSDATRRFRPVAIIKYNLERTNLTENEKKTLKTALIILDDIVKPEKAPFRGKDLEKAIISSKTNNDKMDTSSNNINENFLKKRKQELMDITDDQLISHNQGKVTRIENQEINLDNNIEL